MLVEVRVRLKGSLSRLLEIAKQGLEKSLSRFRGVSGEIWSSTTWVSCV